MSSTHLITGGPITDPKLLALADKVKEAVIVGFQQAVGAKVDPARFKYQSSQMELFNKKYSPPGNVLAAQLSKKSVEVQKSTLRKLQTTAATGTMLRNATVVRGLNPRLAKPVSEQVNVERDFSFMTGTNALTKQRIDALLGHLPSSAFSAIPLDTHAPPRDMSILYKLSSVKCVDETGGWEERFGNDEISMSGITIDEDGLLEKIPEFVVYNHFDDGDVKTYSPAKVLKTFRANTNFAKPKTFMVMLFIAEKDNGGFSDFIADVFSAIKSELTSILVRMKNAAGAYITSEIAAALNLGANLSGPLGTIIGLLAAKILSEIQDFISAAWSDDVFPAAPGHQKLLILESVTANFNGSLSSPIEGTNYRGHGGLYQVNAGWEIKPGF